METIRCRSICLGRADRFGNRRTASLGSIYNFNASPNISHREKLSSSSGLLILYSSADEHVPRTMILSLLREPTRSVVERLASHPSCASSRWSCFFVAATLPRRRSYAVLHFSSSPSLSLLIFVYAYLSRFFPLLSVCSYFCFSFCLSLMRLGSTNWLRSLSLTRRSPFRTPFRDLRSCFGERADEHNFSSRQYRRDAVHPLLFLCYTYFCLRLHTYHVRK